ncbi:ABC transporter substrate-binding protein [Halomonas sp. Bachu 37]|uniref:ABC transporter substrate-binding protein n=1 Tax=Halomonas kashgarensis TaxID=3084920 RepID=UPI0032163712
MSYSSALWAEPEAQDASPTPETEEALSLDTEVNVPEFIESTAPAEPVAEVPVTTVIPADPIEPPPIEIVEIMLDWYPSPQHAALMIAIEQGLFAELGLDVTLITPGDPSLPSKMLAAGEVDFALTRQPLLHLQAHQGTPLVRIATLIETSLTAVIVAGSSLDETPPAALHYGYSTLDSRDVLLSYLRSRTSPRADDPAPELLHFNVANALREERVEAVADGFFHYLPTQLETDGIANTVIRHEALDIPRHEGLVMIANQEHLRRQRDTIVRLIGALEEASHWMVEHPEEAWELLVQARPVLDNSVNQEAWTDILHRVALRPAALDYAGYARFESFLHEAGLVDTPLPVERLALDPYAL